MRTDPLRRLLILACAGALLAGSPAHAAPAARAPRNDTLASCSWDRPGRNPFRGDVVLAVDRYTDIPAEVRARLKQRIAARDYDDLADIRRDSVEGKFQYAAAIREMHFGDGRVCREVTRTRWTDKMHERGMVYCESGHCLLLPTVCRNLSRVDRKPDLVAGDRLAPPGAATGDPALPGDGRARPAAAGAPEPLAAAPAPAPEPVTSSFAEAVAGATVPLVGPVDGGAPLGEGPLPGAAALPPVADVPGRGEGAAPPSFTPVPIAFVPGGGGGPVFVTPPAGGGVPGGGSDTPTVPAIPEPSSWALLGAGLALLLWRVRAQRRATVSAVAGTPKCATQKR